MTELNTRKPLTDLTFKRQPLWVWVIVFAMISTSAGLSANLLPVEGARVLVGVSLGGLGGMFGTLLVNAIFSQVHIAARGDRVILRQFRTSHTIIYKDLRLVRFIPSKFHAVHLATDMVEITVTMPITGSDRNNSFHDLMNELGEIVGWQTGGVTRKEFKPGERVEPVVMFDADEGDVVTTSSVHARRVRRSALVNEVVSVIGLVIPVSLVFAYILALPSSGEMGIPDSYTGLIVSGLLLIAIGFMLLTVGPDNRGIWVFAATIAVLSAVFYVVGHQRAGSDASSLIGGAALCFAAVVAASMLLRQIGLWQISRHDARLADYYAAIDAVIASGAVKDRRDQWNPQD